MKNKKPKAATKVAVSTDKAAKKRKLHKTSENGSDASPKAPAKHKQSLEKLKEQDPEFYKFLQNEDQELLAFSGSESDFSASSDDGDASEQENSVKKSAKPSSRKEKKKASKAMKDFDLSEDSDESDDGIHRPPAKLEVASDSDDEEDVDEDEGETKSDKKAVRDTRVPVTMKMINQWSAELRESSVKALREVIQAFRAAVQQAGSDSVEKSPFKVEGATVFNGVVRMCIKEIPPMLNRYLVMPKKKKDSNKILLPSNSSQWNSVKRVMMSYLRDLVELVSQMTEAAVLNVVLKHISQMVPCFSCFAKLARAVLKRLIRIWSTGEESSRVLAFLSINRLTRLKQDVLLEYTLKQMYLSYVTNSKFTSPTTLPLINFMQHSLVEMLAIDQEVSYQYAFMYIRQLAIHLRNALTVKRKDMCQSVYNWQYIHSLELWSRALSQLHPSDTLEPLIYPLVQTTIGTIKLISSTKYYPLRFHCVRALNRITSSTKTFVPVLPFLIEIFDLTDFSSKKNKNTSLKPFNFACILKLSKAQLKEKAFRDGVIDQLYEHLMEAFHAHAHTIGFPELALPPLLQMKKFLKTCKVPNYTKQIKQIVDKVEETSRVITQRRKTAALRLADNKAVDLWEKKSKEDGTPLGKFYASWRKLRDRELQFEVSKKDYISQDDLPVIERRTKTTKSAGEREKVDFEKMFEGSDDSDDETRFLLKEERAKKKQKTSKKQNDDSDDYSDFDDDELALLARSGSEDDSDGSIEMESEDEDENQDGEDEEEDEMENDDDDDIDDEGDLVEDFHFSDDSDD